MKQHVIPHFELKNEITYGMRTSKPLPGDWFSRRQGKPGEYLRYSLLHVQTQIEFRQAYLPGLWSLTMMVIRSILQKTFKRLSL